MYITGTIKWLEQSGDAGCVARFFWYGDGAALYSVQRTIDVNVLMNKFSGKMIFIKWCQMDEGALD